MLGERFVEYYGGLIALLTPVLWLLNRYVFPQVKNIVNGWSSSKRNGEVQKMLVLFQAARHARVDNMKMQIALSYVTSRLTRGRIEGLMGFISYVVGGTAITLLATIKSSLLRSMEVDGLNLMAMYAFPLCISAIGVFSILRSQRNIKKAAHLRNAICGQPGFLDKTTKRLLQITSNGTVNMTLLNSVQNEIQVARGVSQIDWLALM